MNTTRKNVKACIKTYCGEEFPKRQKAFANKLLGAFSKTKKSINYKKHKQSQEVCATSYCNPTCEGTIFEAGKKASKSLTKRLKKLSKGNPKTHKLLLSLEKESRARIFGTKTNVLKDGFYEKLPKKTVEEIKKKGAISGCAVSVL